MIEPAEHEEALRRLFPRLPHQELQEVGEFLHGYCAILLRIYERMERERQDFDDSPRAFYDESKGRFPKN